jgi:hypothetical protein
VERPEEKRPLGRPARRWILNWGFKNWDGGVLDWIDLAENRDRCRAFSNAVMNFRVP